MAWSCRAERRYDDSGEAVVPRGSRGRCLRPVATYYDRQEVRNPADREASMFHALPGLIRHALDNAPVSSPSSWPASSRTRSPAAPTSRACRCCASPSSASCRRRHRPFGRLTATPLARLARIFASPGPIYDPEGARTDYWRFARAMYAAGFRTGDIVHNSFSYHLTPAGSMAESGARALGLPVIPGGTGQTELQLRALADIGATAYAGTPSFLLTLLEKGRELGIADLVADQGAGLGRGVPAGDARRGWRRSSASAPCSATPAPISA